MSYFKQPNTHVLKQSSLISFQWLIIIKNYPSGDKSVKGTLLNVLTTSPKREGEASHPDPDMVGLRVGGGVEAGIARRCKPALNPHPVISLVKIRC